MSLFTNELPFQDHAASDLEPAPIDDHQVLSEIGPLGHEITHRPAVHGGYVLEARRDHFRCAFGPICLTLEAADAARDYVLEHAERMHTGFVASGPVAYPAWRGEASWQAFRAVWQEALI